jgi:hypothetical protein
MMKGEFTCPPDNLSRPNLDQLKRQARELLNEQRAGTLQACQRIREFHPRYAAASDTSIRAATFMLSDSHLTIAREYGFPSWARLRTFVREEDASSLELPQHERITDRRVRQAVDLLDLREDPNRFNPQGAHSHSTPMHQAALAGHGDTIRLLVEHGARLDIKDILWDETPADWADYAGHRETAAYLRAAKRP